MSITTHWGIQFHDYTPVIQNHSTKKLKYSSSKSKQRQSTNPILILACNDAQKYSNAMSMSCEVDTSPTGIQKHTRTQNMHGKPIYDKYKIVAALSGPARLHRYHTAEIIALIAGNPRCEVRRARETAVYLPSPWAWFLRSASHHHPSRYTRP